MPPLKASVRASYGWAAMPARTSLRASSFSTTGCGTLVCSALYERVALIVTTHVRFADWTQVFGEERLTAALLDRLTYRAHILEFVGESFRFRQRLRRETQKQKG